MKAKIDKLNNKILCDHVFKLVTVKQPHPSGLKNIYIEKRKVRCKKCGIEHDFEE